MFGGALLIGIVFMVISLIVSGVMKRKFKKYSKENILAGMSGKEAAEKMLRDHGITNVRVISVEGELTDHYNPSNRTVNLSNDVYHGRSAASVAVATHECGHAVQHAKAYSMLSLRDQLVPLQNISAKVMNFLFIALMFGGFMIQGFFPTAILIVIGYYAVFTLFSFVTLPVEFDASKRALAWMSDTGMVNDREYGMAKDALFWAAMTYVVVALGSLAQLLFYLSIFLGGDE